MEHLWGMDPWMSHRGKMKNQWWIAPPVVTGPVGEPPMSEPTVEEAEEAYPVHDSQEEDPPGEDEPLEVLQMENNGQGPPSETRCCLRRRHRRKLFLWLVYLYQASQSPPSRRRAGLGCFGTTEGRLPRAAQDSDAY